MTTWPAWAPLQGRRSNLTACGLGLVSALALPPLHVIPVLFLTIPALLRVIDGAGGVGAAARRGFWFGFGLHLVGLYWITEAILLESARYWWFVPLAVPALSMILALFIAVPCAAARAVRPGWRRVAILAGAWVLSDLARQFVGTGFPWNPLGSVWAIPGAVGDIMIQPAAWVGTPGLTLATVLAASLPSLGRRGWAAAVALIAAWAGAGTWRLSTPDGPGPGIMAVLVQGNVAQGQKFDRALAVSVFRRHLALSAEGVAAAGGRPSVVIWPETASAPFWLQSDPAAREAIAQAIAPAKGALIGTLTFSAGAPSMDPGNVPYNTMAALRADGSIGGLYDKWHLVPFGEYPPSWVPLAIQIVPGHFGFGKGPATLRLPDMPPIGGLICYEAIFPGQVVDRADRPDWMVNITNDAWFGNSSGPRQHLAAARLRAVEEGLPLMRAANTGISAGFDAYGRELGRLPMGVAGVLTLALPPKLPETGFARFGLFVPGILALALVGLGMVSRRGRRPRP
jgi:apolipoprotein N-acyltransferase